MRLFFEDEELVETETVVIGADSFGRPLTMQRNKCIKE